MNRDNTPGASHITRRRFLIRTAAAGCLAATGLRCSGDPESNGDAKPFHFVAFNDTHVRDEACVAYLRKAVARIHEVGRETPLDFAILCGDIATDGRPRAGDARRRPG